MSSSIKLCFRSTPLFHSRPGSPASLAGLGSLLRAGPGSPTPSPSLARAPLHSSICEEKPLPLEVTVCLEQLWVEPSGSVGPRATKCFLARDLGGTTLLCLLCPGPAPALAMLKYETVSDSRERLAWGAVRRVPARDAVPLSDLDLVLVLDPAGSVLLYSRSGEQYRDWRFPSPGSWWRQPPPCCKTTGSHLQPRKPGQLNSKLLKNLLT